MARSAIVLLSLGVAKARFGGRQDEPLDLFDRDLAVEPPRTTASARFDLPLDLSGKWHRWHGTGWAGTTFKLWVWQECLEVTFAGWFRSGATFPLHHQVANGEYITYDDTETSKTISGYFSYKSIIAAPTQVEAADGATAVLVFYVEEGMPQITQPDGSITSYDYPAELAVWYIDAQGRLVFQQNTSLVPDGADFMRMEKEAGVPCEHPHTNPQSEYCAQHTSAQLDRYDAFTPACCEDGYGGRTELYRSIANDAWADYVAPCPRPGGYDEQLDLFDRDLVAEPPRTLSSARFDLPLDLSGVWQGSTFKQWVWQECLEVTISGERRFGAGFPLHHQVANGEYITYDDTETSGKIDGYFSYKSIIAAPTQVEAVDGATAVLVFYVDEGLPPITQADESITSYDFPAELAIRYIDAQGRLVFQQNRSLLPSGADFMRMERDTGVPCEHPQTNPQSEYCAQHGLVQTDRYDAFTPACCLDGYGGSTEPYTNLAHAKWHGYVASC